jgi:hypothetical protein
MKTASTLLLVAVVALAGCGSGGSDTTPGTGQGATGATSHGGGGQAGSGADGGGGSAATGGSAGEGALGGTGGGEAGSGGTGGSEPTCPTGDTRCNDLDVETCNPEGTAWGFTETCPFVCSGGTCTGICVPNSHQCRGLVPQTCDNTGQWVDSQACPFVCQAGSCSGACAPNSMQCSGSSTETCNANGQWGAPVPCPAPAHANPTCTGNGVCGWSCQGGYDNCNGQPGDGCEADLTSPATCGTCANHCNGAGGTPTCSNGNCGIVCHGQHGNCNNSAADGCEIPLGTTSNCLGCGDSCSAPAHATAVCTPGGCDFTCSGLWDNCDGNDGNGCEKDVSADAFNCGGCNTSCYGGTCSAGTCTPGITFVADASNITSVALGTPYAVNEVYWTSSNGSVNKAPASGGSTTVLATGQGVAEAVQTDGLNAIWSKSDVPKAIRSIPIGGGSQTDLVTGHGPVEMTHDAQYLYWTAETDYDPCYCWDPSNTPIYKMGIAGGVPVTINTGGGPNPLLWNSWPGIGNYGPDVYRLTWQDEYANGCLVMHNKVNPVMDRQACNINIGGINTFAASKFLTVSPNGTGVFYTTLSIVGKAIIRVNPADGVSSLVATTSSLTVRGLAADDSYVYVIGRFGASGAYRIMRYPLSGGSAEYLIDNQYNADNILVDATHVYWSIEGLQFGGNPPILDPVIVRMAK